MTRDVTICSFIEHYCVQLPRADPLCIYHRRANQYHLKSEVGGFVYGHSGDLGTTGFIASQKLGKKTFRSRNFKLISCSHHLE